MPTEGNYGPPDQNSSTSTTIVYQLPSTIVGKEFCFFNSRNATSANANPIEILTTLGEYIIGDDGSRSNAHGNITSMGAGGDKGCVVGVDTTHWQFYKFGGTSGTWTLN